ncbi:MAG: carboxypeptidase regulatory-like domain-containing protein, partial [Alloprevotella sp.]
MYNMNHIIKQMTGVGKILLLGALLMMTATVWAQSEQTLKGRVTDSEGNPIAGAIVNIAEQSRIVLTDDEGCFTLKGVRLTDE